MINLHKGNLLANVKSGIIVHGCNSKGVMGAGFAKSLKDLYPEAYKDYKRVCDGECYGWPNIVGQIVTTQINDNLCVISAITQKEFGRDNKQYVDYKAIEQCFEQVYKVIEQITEYRMLELGKQNNIVTIEEAIPEVHFPLIGAGLGGGDWNIISEIIERKLPEPISKNLWVLR